MKIPSMSGEWLLVRADALPPVYETVLRMKLELLSNPQLSVCEAARRYGISRSAYYKYKDAVQAYIGRDATARMTLRVLLQDSPGVLSGLLSAVAKSGVNVLTVDQQAPINGIATVVLCLQAGDGRLSPELLADKIGHIHGVQRILDIKQEGGNNG